MSASGAGGCGPGPGPTPGAGSGASNPRKFSEKIALHTQRQAEETAAFQEVMMDISSTRLQAQKRLARNQGPYYGGSLPDVNQIGRNHQDFQGSFSSTLESSRSTRHHGLVERVQRDRRFVSPVRPYRNRQMDNSAYNPAYLSPPPDPSWRRNWCGNFPGDRSHLFRLPTTALNRTNSDSALHTSVMNPPSGDHFSPGHSLTPQAPRRTGQTEGEGRRMFPYPVPPIEENVLDEGKLLKPWDSKKLPMLSSRPKSCEVPGINIFPSPEQPSSTTAHLPPAALNTGGSLPDLSSLHFPSPLPTPLDHDEPGAYPGSAPLSGGNSTGNLASTLTQLGINQANGQGLAFHQHSPGLLASLQSALSHPSLHSSLSNPNIQSSLGSHSFPNSLSSASLHSSLSNPSLQSSLCSSPSLTSSLSSQSLHSSLSNSSLSGQSVASGNPSYSSAVGVSGSCAAAAAYSPLLGGQGQPQLSTSPRRRAQLSPLVLPLGGEGRRHPSKQFSPTISPTLSSITQGVPLDTSKLPLDQRLPPYPFNQPLHQQNQLHQNHHAQQNPAGCVPANSQQQQQQQPPPSSTSTSSVSSSSVSSSSSLGQQNPHHAQMHRLQQQNRPNPPPQPQHHHPHHHPYQQQPQQQQQQQQQQLQQHQQEHQQHQQQQQQNLQLLNLRNAHNQQIQQQHFGTQRPASGPADPSSTPLIKSETQLDQCDQSLQGHADPHRPSGLMQLQQINHSLSSDLGLYNDSLFHSLLDDPYLSAQLTGRANQQFSMEGPGEGLCLGDGGLQDRNQYPSPQGSLELPDLGHHHHHHQQHQQELLNLHNHNYGSTEPRHAVPNIILTGGSPPGLSKEITSALSHVPGFEMDPFSLDDPLRMDPLALDMLEGDLMLADPSVEDSFRSDRLK